VIVHELMPRPYGPDGDEGDSTNLGTNRRHANFEEGKWVGLPTRVFVLYMLRVRIPT
jgi:hypothetical protein